MLKHSVSPEAILRTRVDEYFDSVRFCGYKAELVEGEYAVVYSSSIDDFAFAELAEHSVMVYTDNMDNRDPSVPECILFVILT